MNKWWISDNFGHTQICLEHEASETSQLRNESNIAQYVG